MQSLGAEYVQHRWIVSCARTVDTQRCMWQRCAPCAVIAPIPPAAALQPLAGPWWHALKPCSHPAPLTTVIVHVFGPVQAAAPAPDTASLAGAVQLCVATPLECAVCWVVGVVGAHICTATSLWPSVGLLTLWWVLRASVSHQHQCPSQKQVQ